MKWDPALKSIQPPKVVFSTQRFSIEQMKCFEGYRNLRAYHPGLGNLQPTLKDCSGELQVILDHYWKWNSQTVPVKRGPMNVSLVTTSGTTKEADAFCKITHTVDPIRWIKGKYSTEPSRKEEYARYSKKVSDPMNQAYVEALTYYCVSKLRESNASLHFPLFYGSFTAVADTYRLNITEDFESYKHTKWYWNGIDTNTFALHVDGETETMSLLDELTRRPSFLEDDASSNDSESEDDTTDEELEDEQETHDSHEDASIHSADNISFKTGPGDSTDEESCIDSPEFFMDIHNFPVILMYLEKNEGVLDDLLNERDTLVHRPGTPQWETMWSAWVFQIIAACCVMQHTMSLTHNDLHTNNIVWSPTTDEFIYYKRNNGTLWKVPTYGKIFRVIDFGRAIFRIQNRVVYSDDFVEGNDAATQYNFGPLRDPSSHEVLPNPSFDLCRLAVSMFENLFPEEPARKKGGKVLSSEPGLEVTETTSELFNIMWSWMVTDFGENVLINGEGEEKYPNFDLYKVIAEECHQARPCDQVEKKPFSQFIVKGSVASAEQKVYSLFF
jgi:hypothetical protein